MSDWGDFPEVERTLIDVETADGLLARRVGPEDLSAEYQAVAALLEAARAPARPEELASGTETVTAMARVRSRATMTTTPRRGRMQLTHVRRRTAALVAGALLAATAATATAALPDAAADAARTVLETLGISPPNATRPSGEKEAPSESQAENGKGAEISQLALTTELEGVEKGAAISTAASDGRSQAGQHGNAGAATPNAGGSETADAASGGASAKGTDVADAASGGASAAGSANAETNPAAAAAAGGQSHRP